MTTGKIQLLPLQWWPESAPPGCNSVKVSQNLGATAVAPVAPVDTFMHILEPSNVTVSFDSTEAGLTNRSSDTLLRFVLVFLTQTLYMYFLGNRTSTPNSVHEL